MTRWFARARPAITLGTHGPRCWPTTLRVPLRQAAAHMHVIGKTGSGKSRFLASLYLELLAHGQPAILVDPHGDLARLILQHLVARGLYDQISGRDPFARLIYLDLQAAERADRYLPFNVLAHPARPHTIGSHIVEAMHRAWPSLGGGAAPRFDKLVKYGVKVLVSNRLTLPALCDFLTNQVFRAALVQHESDPDIARFWSGWYDQLPPRVQLDYADSTLSRISLLTYAPVLKYSLGQPDLALDFRQLLDAGTSVIINLAVEDQDVRRLFGCLFTVFAEIGAFSRADVAAELRRGSAHFIVDEFQYFSAQSKEAFGRYLSEARKFGVHAVFAHQNMSQLDDDLIGALQNVGIEVVLQLGELDARSTARALGRVAPKTVRQTVTREESESAGMAEQWEQWKQTLQDLRTGEAYIKLQRGPATRVRTPWLPDPVVDARMLADVEATYLGRYFRHLSEIPPLTVPPPPPRRMTRRVEELA